MATTPFDTLKAKGTLTRFGFPEEQATGIVTMTRDAVSESVATKEDIARLETRLMKGLVIAAGSIIATLLAIVVALGTIAVELSSMLLQN